MAQRGKAYHGGPVCTGMGVGAEVLLGRPAWTWMDGMDVDGAVMEVDGVVMVVRNEILRTIALARLSPGRVRR
jgi:hypothetical protein